MLRDKQTKTRKGKRQTRKENVVKILTRHVCFQSNVESLFHKFIEVYFKLQLFLQDIHSLLARLSPFFGVKWLFILAKLFCLRKNQKSAATCAAMVFLAQHLREPILMKLVLVVNLLKTMGDHPTNLCVVCRFLTRQQNTKGTRVPARKRNSGDPPKFQLLNRTCQRWILPLQEIVCQEHCKKQEIIKKRESQITDGEFLCSHGILLCEEENGSFFGS